MFESVERLRDAGFAGFVPLLSLEHTSVPDEGGVYIVVATSLRKRLRQFRDCGNGRPVGHWGGRYLWQIDDCEKLLVGWRTSRAPAQDEGRLLRESRDQFGQMPFANIASGVTLADDLDASATVEDALALNDADAPYEDVELLIAALRASAKAVMNFASVYEADAAVLTVEDKRRLARAARLMNEVLGEFS